MWPQSACCIHNVVPFYNSVQRNNLFNCLVRGHFLNLATQDKRVYGPQSTFGAAKGIEASSPCSDRDHLPPNYSGCLARLRAMQPVEPHSGNSMHPPQRRRTLAGFCFPRWLHTPSLPWLPRRVPISAENPTLENAKVVRREISLPLSQISSLFLFLFLGDFFTSWNHEHHPRVFHSSMNMVNPIRATKPSYCSQGLTFLDVRLIWLAS